MTRKLLGIFAIIFFSFISIAKDDILDQVISIQFENTPIKAILHEIEKSGKINFSYNPEIIDTDKKINISLYQKTIRYGLNVIFNKKVELKAISNHILILKKDLVDEPSRAPNQKIEILITGTVTDNETNQPIPFASVYDIDSKHSVLANKNGVFNLNISNNQSTIKLYYAKSEYRTAVRLIEFKELNKIDGSQGLYQQIEEINKLPSPAVPKKVWIEFEDKTISGELFSMNASKHHENLKHINENRWAQISLIPRVSLNTGNPYSGILYNHFSLNILGGYSKGLKGIEIGGLANILKKEAVGAQFGGITNLVGGHFTGLQLSGVSNVVKKDFLGLQIGGISNAVRQNFLGIQTAIIYNATNQKFSGIQLSLIGNKVDGKLFGLQIGGIVNKVQKKMNGIQIAGFTSLAKDGFNGLQFSGLVNHTSNTSNGLQLSLVQNVALKKYVGAQITGFMNSAIDGANFFQMAGLVNIAHKNNGLQISGLVNFSKQNNGLQLGIINLSKTNKGLSIGLVNFVWDGYHKIEVVTNETSIANIRLKTGTKRLYNIYSLGKQFNGIQNLTSLGFGFGAVYNVSEKIAISTDIEGIIAFNQQNDFTELGKFSPSFDFKLSDHFAIFAGPTFNINTKMLSQSALVLNEYSIYEDNLNGEYVNIWVGGQFGIRF
ncbi:MAG: carboxypeptidase-like regulatory domain-containing protein [Crocinitomicaceae bacterium]